MERLKVLAAVFNQGLGCGLLSVKDIIHWSDKVIQILDNPPYDFIELSMMSSAKIDDVEVKLYEFYRESEIDNQLVVNMLLPVIFQKLSTNELDIQKAVKSTIRLLIQTNFYSNQEYYELSRMDDAYDLAVDNVYGNLKQVTLEYEQAISKYQFYYLHFLELYKTVMNTEWESFK